MAIRHPVTGVVLNEINITRKALGSRESETARLLRRDGHKLQDIAAMLGTNQGRVCAAIGLDDAAQLSLI